MVIQSQEMNTELSYPTVIGLLDKDQANYSVGDVISLTCVSSKMKPAPR